MLLLAGPGGPVHGLAFAPDGRLLAVGAAGRVQVWDALGQTLLHDWPAAEQSSHAVRFDPTGRYLYAVVDVHQLTVFDTRTGKAAATLGGPFAQDDFGRPLAAYPRDCLTPDGLWVIGLPGRAVDGWRVGHDLRWERSIESFGLAGDLDVARCPVAFSPAHPRAAIGLYGSVAVFDPTAGQRMKTFRHAHEFADYAVSLRLAFHPTEYLLACADDAQLALYESETGNKAARAVLGEPVAALAFTPDGETLYAAVRGGRVRRWYLPPPIDRTLWNWWEAHPMEERSAWEWAGWLGDLTALAVSPDGTTAAADARGAVLVWDLADGD